MRYNHAIKWKGVTFKNHELIFAFGFLLTFTSFSFHGINISDKITIIVITILFFVKHFRSCMNFIVRECILYTVFIAFGLLGYAFGEGGVRVLLFDFNYIIQIMMLSGFVYLFNTSSISQESYLKIIYVINVFVGAIGILQYFFWKSITKILMFFVESVYENESLSRHRIGSLYDNPNLFAGMMVCMSLLGILYWFETSKSKYVVGTMIMIFALLLTGTRTALVVFVIGVVLICALKKELKQRKKSVFLIIFGIAVVLLIAYKGLLSRFAVYFSGSNNIDLMMGKRNIIWGVLLSVMSKNLLLGIGNGMSEIVTYEQIGYGFGPHSTYVGVVSETGVIGGGAFILFLLWVFIKGREITETKTRHLFYVLYSSMLLLQITESHLRAFMQFILVFWVIVSIPFCCDKDT